MIVRGNDEPDWGIEAINEPAGKIAQAIVLSLTRRDLKAGNEVSAESLDYINRLLALPGDPRRHALVIFAHDLNWFYAVDPDWAESNLLSVLETGDKRDRDALWSGFFWGNPVSQRLYMRMKHSLLNLAKDKSQSYRNVYGPLASHVLLGWGSWDQETDQRCTSNEEMRDVLLNANDDFRLEILSWVEIRLNSQEEEVAAKWTELLLELLRDLWPRQKSVKTPNVSARLLFLAFSNIDRLPEVANAILPLLTIIDRGPPIHPDVRESDVFERYPRQCLALSACGSARQRCAMAI